MLLAVVRPKDSSTTRARLLPVPTVMLLKFILVALSAVTSAVPLASKATATFARLPSGVCYLPNSLANLVPIGLPKPLQGSGPGPARNIPLSPLVTSTKATWFRQRTGAIKPSPFPIAANRPVIRGDTALVPPIGPSCPPATMSQPVSGSALAARSGTIRPGPFGTPAIHGASDGRKALEKPPPVPLPSGFPGLLFQTDSSNPNVSSTVLVPPQAITCGQEAGASTLAGFGPPSLLSLSPAAASTTVPPSVSSLIVDSSCLTECLF